MNSQMLLIHRLLRRDHSHALYDIAHVPRRVPQRLERLRLADAVGRLDFQVINSSTLRLERDSPFAERILAQVLPQLRLAPVSAAIFGKQYLRDAVAAIESNSPQGDAPRHGEF